jgi:hypothetical protein
MDISLKTLLPMVRDTIIAPRQGATAIINLGLPASIGWTALLLMAVGSAVFTHLSLVMMPQAEAAFFGSVMNSPIRTAIMQWGVMILSVHMIHRIGRWRGGKGQLSDALILVAWLQFILLCMQVLQLVTLVLMPPVSELLGILGLVLFFWLLTNFIAELHGFKSLGLTFVAVLICLFITGILLSFVLALVLGLPAAGA